MEPVCKQPAPASGTIPQMVSMEALVYNLQIHIEVPGGHRYATGLPKHTRREQTSQQEKHKHQSVITFVSLEGHWKLFSKAAEEKAEQALE